MITPKVSVIVPAYNVAKWLPRCLESLMKQSYKNLEIIVINDGSTDETGKILDDFTKKDNRINAIHQKNRGLIETREQGIMIASGIYTGFVDGDDSVLPDMYERLVNNAIKYEASISQCGMLYCLPNGKEVPMYGTKELFVYNKIEGINALLRNDKMEPSLCNKIYKTELLKDSCLDKSVLNNEDLLRNFVLFSRCEKSVFEDFCGYLYWRREGSMSNNNFLIEGYKNIFKARKTILNNAGVNVKNAAHYCYLSAVLSCYNTMIDINDKEAKRLKIDCRKELKIHKNTLCVLNRKRIFFALAILYIPNVYEIVYKVYLNCKK